jgi:octaprenyl-diphosphate synthase
MPNFQKIITDLAPDLQKLDQIILEFAQGRAPLIQEISNHLINSGGKRIRPILLILSAKLCGSKNNEDYLNLASAVELIHSATLLHDDVVDNSLIRRGKKTANAIWDNKASILVGDYLFSIAFQLMVRSKNLAILDLLAKSSSIMSDGEVLQLENSNDIALSEEKYLQIIFCKTAVLFSASCESGALLNNRSSSEISALREFGKNLGIIFQIVDDVLDYSSKKEVMGKEAFEDFFEGKVTLPVILTCKKATPDEVKKISDIFLNNLAANEKNQDGLNYFLSLMAKYQALDLAKSMAAEYKAKAINDLSIFPESELKQNLIDILEYSLIRIS